MPPCELMAGLLQKSWVNLGSDFILPRDATYLSNLPSPPSPVMVLTLALAEPVVVGIRDWPQARARRRSLCPMFTTICVLVMSWTVVTQPCFTPAFSCKF